MRHRESLVGLQGRREGLLGPRAVREQLVHAVLEALGSNGRRGRDFKSVAVGDGHKEASIAGCRRACRGW